VWGSKAYLDSLIGYFKTIFKNHGLVSIEIRDCLSTWRNGRSGMEAITKRLDRIYLLEDLILLVGRYRTWVAYQYISYHALVLLHLDGILRKVAYPFKLNPTRLGGSGVYCSST
jgi:hypothetical protein